MFAASLGLSPNYLTISWYFCFKIPLFGLKLDTQTKPVGAQSMILRNLQGNVGIALQICLFIKS
jgi:hypothetical protein